MKIYAEVESDRARKGQGGNKKIDVKLLIGSKQLPTTVAHLILTYDKPFFYLHRDEILVGQWLEKDKTITKITT